MPMYANINGTMREIQAWYNNIGGAAREDINKYANISGVQKEIFSTGMPLSWFFVGDNVYVLESGIPKEYIIAAHDFHGAGYTTLVRKYLLPSSGTFANAKSYLANTYLSWLPAWLVGTLRNSYSDEGGPFTAKSVLLSKAEYTGTGSGGIPYFSVATNRRAAKEANPGTNLEHWTRTEEYGGSSRYYKQYINTAGGILESQYDSSEGYRPAIAPQSTVVVSGDGVLVQS